MTGDEHYKESERLLQQADERFGRWEDSGQEHHLAAARVLASMARGHAQLATAAATHAPRRLAPGGVVRAPGGKLPGGQYL